MTDSSNEWCSEEMTSVRRGPARTLEALGWGLFFIWLGTVLLVEVPAGVALLGVGGITIGIQVARRVFHLKLEPFWLAAGVVFLASGLWRVLEAEVPLVPVLLLLGGVAVVLTRLFPSR